ncbi:family 16 glycosylhydrolase [Mycolicibacterium sphagni]|uniref:family 16 glycosylhydrolase n=1 Tax=Mycolicibacterium sphagni TaxID=1786 RepID=UPI0021F2DE56|nr:family 16 glycosylhydrolase [Mycolicibacterium sphagni]
MPGFICARNFRLAETSLAPHCGWVGGALVALGLGTSIAAGCGAAAADSTPGPPSSTSSAVQSRDSAAPAKAVGKSGPALSPRGVAVSRVQGQQATIAGPARRSRASAVVAPTAVNVPSVGSTGRSAAATTVTQAAAASVGDALSLNANVTTKSASTFESPVSIINSLIRQIQITFFNKTPTISYNSSDNVENSDGTITGQIIGNDSDGDKLTYTVSKPLNGGTVAIDPDGYFTYTPGADFVQDGSTDLFTATVSDAQNGFRIHGLLGLLIPGWGSAASISVRVNGVSAVGSDPGSAGAPPTDGAGAGGGAGSPAGAGTATNDGLGNWGQPTRSTYFTDSSALAGWWIYSGQTQQGNRTASAISFADGIMTLTGDASGNDAGIALGPGQMYGAWEVRMRAPAGAANYDPVLLLWPDAENWPTGGEIDFAEIWDDPARQAVNSVLHYSSTNQQAGATMTIDATQWHTYAVTWTPTAITTYVDGIPIFTTTDTSAFPPGPMHLCIQLDVGGSDIAAGAQMQVAWMKEWSLDSIV